MKAPGRRKTARQLTESKALYDIARAIASSLTLDERLEALMERLGPAAGAQRAMVSLLDAEDPAHFRLRLAYDSSKADPWLRHLDLSSERYPEIQEAIRTRRPLVIPDVFSEPLLAPVREHLKTVGLRSLVVAPLIVRERVIGAVNLGYVGQGRTFSHGEVRFYQSMADLAAAAIANAQLFHQVAQAKTEWENTFNAITDLVAIVDADSRLLRVNRAWAERLRAAPDQLVGRHLSTLLRGTGESWPMSPHAQTLATGKPTTLEVEDPHLGGLFLVTTSPLLDAGGQTVGSVLIARDITEMKRLEEEARQRQRFEDISRAKSVFIATMSHELRSPLAAILGLAEVLRGKTYGPLTERQERYIGLIDESGKHLRDLINNTLDVSRMEAGKIELARERVWLHPTVEAMLALVHAQAGKAGVRLGSDIPPDLPPVLADRVRLKQILFNLLSNAIKFIPAGGTITVRARTVMAEEHGSGGAEVPSPLPLCPSAPQPFLEIAVTDTGIGITAGDIPKLFKEFTQLEAGRLPERQGTGLGLAITKRLVELHGGRIWVESQGEGFGSTFRLTLPLA
jgi:PAS domain S-box-containing protein